ncbi:GGDEF domain-containing protein [Mesobacillus boroniphilus]|uniref:GGDEF domain-containing protein n=1 Tax=Mesobacillus boroniphilus TaxID=308892 RepID=A0A944GX81_9BACI|nr:GGDEF domain-containing protein [Mesobacillus boroniphilus]MBS8265434.1 GGDEF domain-containing protein [Mesobacillus boroniphilus]
MLKARLYDLTLFFTAVAVAFGLGAFTIDKNIFLIALFIYWLFSTLYNHLRITAQNGTLKFDYGISYSLSFGIFAGPLGLFIFETIFRFTVYFSRKSSKTADEDEFWDTFYNIGAHVLIYSIGYFLFQLGYPLFETIPFGFWILMCILAVTTTLISYTFLSTAFYILGEIKSLQQAIKFYKESNNWLDLGKTAFTNGLLLLLLEEQRWEMVVGLFILNYLVSRSFHSKSQSIQNKIERDKFEQMAYTDFLTGIPNRAYMDKKMSELNQAGERVGIVVADIDKFKLINDSYNHAVGDRVIQHFANTLKTYLSENDYVFRSGGEEFTMILRNKPFSQNIDLVERIRHGIETSSVEVDYQSEKHAVSITSSFGLYYFKVNHHTSMEKGYIFADQLLLQSKELGKNKVTCKDELPKHAPIGVM